MPDASGHEAAAQETVAGEPLVQPEEALANAEAVCVRHGEPGVVGDHAEVRHVVVEALHLEEHHAEITCALGYGGPGGRLEGLTVGHAVADGGVA